MAQAGIRDIFLPYNILGERKLERYGEALLALLRRGEAASGAAAADSGT